MRYRRLLIVALFPLVLAGCATTAPTGGVSQTDPTLAEGEPGMRPLGNSGSGATLILSGILTRESFKLTSMRVVGSRLAGKSSDPDQFRVTLLNVAGQELETVRMWSPLLRLDWDSTDKHETATTLAQRAVNISVPASIALNQVVLGWPDGKKVATIKVGPEIYRFCLQSPQNPACNVATR